MGFVPAVEEFPPTTISEDLLRAYAEKRDFPGLPATSRIGVHLRFGTISIRHCVRIGLQLSATWLNELIWREFYMQILWNFPQVGEGKSFKSAYDRIPWRNNPDEFTRWCEGKTGYAIVDAGMRELNSTGFMHNRVRMIAASFLVKHLLIDWRWGEAYFASKLLDFDFSANNGGWQWAASSGCDAAPYFRVFNPLLQTQKFDKNLNYIKKWVPEHNSLSYIQYAVVEHSFARERVLKVFKEALGAIVAN
jgi:deoxyribodipyrimidine photo-lyase